MVIEFAHYLEDLFHKEGYGDMIIRGEIFASLNGRDPQLLVDPEFDLTSTGRLWVPGGIGSCP